MDNKKEQLEGAAALSAYNKEPASVRDIMAKPGKHDNFKSEKPESPEVLLSDHAVTCTLKGEQEGSHGFVSAMPARLVFSNGCAERLFDSKQETVVEPIQLNSSKISACTTSGAYSIPTSQVPGFDRRLIERRKSKQSMPVLEHPFLYNVNGSKDFNSRTSDSSQLVPSHEHGLDQIIKNPRNAGQAALGMGESSTIGYDSNPIKVCIVSNRRSQLKTLLAGLSRKPAIMVAGQLASNAALVLERLEKWHPQLLMLDSVLLNHFDTDWLTRVQLKIPAIRIVLIQDRVCPDLTDEIRRHRIRGCLFMNTSPEVYEKAVRAIARGDLWLPRDVLAKVFLDLLEPCCQIDAETKIDRSISNVMDTLTNREQQLVRLLTQGLSNKQIARDLDIMEDTVKKHLQNIFRKLGVRRRTLVALRQVAGN